MRIIIKVSVLLTLVFCFSCEKEGLIVKCADCLSEEPLKINLDVKLDNTYSGVATIINVYEGNLEDSVLYRTFTTSSTTTTISVTVSKKYTVTATYYYVGNDYYVAVDSATPRVKYEKSQCDNPCYFVYDKDIDLRLKYTNSRKKII
jgi:hypothetical protein